MLKISFFFKQTGIGSGCVENEIDRNQKVKDKKCTIKIFYKFYLS